MAGKVIAYASPPRTIPRMKKFISAVILMLWSVAILVGQAKRPGSAQRDGPKLSIDRQSKAIGRPSPSYFGAPFSENKETGTGFFVGPDGIVVTAKHVIVSRPNVPCDTSPLKPPQPPQPPQFGKPEPKSVQASKILIAWPQVSQHVEGLTIMSSFVGVRARVLACDDKHDIAVLEPEHNPLTFPDKATTPFAKLGDKTVFMQSEKRGPAVLSANVFATEIQYSLLDTLLQMRRS